MQQGHPSTRAPAPARLGDRLPGRPAPRLESWHLLQRLPRPRQAWSGGGRPERHHVVEEGHELPVADQAEQAQLNAKAGWGTAVTPR
jgi:hypothetical protein